MKDNRFNTDQTVTLLKIQALLAGAHELSRSMDEGTRHTDTKFMSYLIKMARMEVGAKFEKFGVAANASDKGGTLDSI